ncbi:MAG: fumarylacetoacetate hydrolase family protein [Rhodospirillales bacterium]|jgi:acylpyruvate hydrolase|nr:fumarylacetoacetate hydrolase family protein [Rhodospirillales bacterium]MDP6882850.1 fumarylacetoacetate hydrolase family protein [Rhodospirillales bacterium]
MRLVTFEEARRCRVGAVISTGPGRRDRKAVDLQAAGRVMKRRTGKANRLVGVDDMIGLLGTGHTGMADAKRAVRMVAREIRENGGEIPARLAKVAFARFRLCAPIPRPPKFVCVGINYMDHAKETKTPIPEVPILFSKFPSSVIGPQDRIVLPRASKMVDYEGEFTFVIGKKGRNIPKSKAMKYVAGYTVVNDVSARDFQKRTSQWLPGKTFDTFGVMGPEIVTVDEVPRPGKMSVKTWVNDELRQSSNTDQLIFGIRDLIADISRIWTLEPGDVIATGTPGGVGMYSKPPKLLKAGDWVRIEIEGVGVLRNKVVAEKKQTRRRRKK